MVNMTKAKEAFDQNQIQDKVPLYVDLVPYFGNISNSPDVSNAKAPFALKFKFEKILSATGEVVNCAIEPVVTAFNSTQLDVDINLTSPSSEVFFGTWFISPCDILRYFIKVGNSTSLTDPTANQQEIFNISEPD